MSDVCTKTDDCAKTEMVRDILGCVANKWALVLIDELDGETLRFNELRRRVGGISQKVLSQALRELERNGLVARKVYAEVPPRVEYRLTPMGLSLGRAVCDIWVWTGRRYRAVGEARERFESAKPAPTAAARAMKRAPAR